MTHAIRWTIEKISQRLGLIEPLAYRRRAPLAPFRYLALSDPATQPPVAPDFADDNWPIIAPNTHWGQPHTDFVLRSAFQVPAD
jgi:alpha-mannosidase